MLRKHDTLRNSNNIVGFLPILGDAVVSGEEEVKIATFKLLNVLVKVPFNGSDSSDLYKVAVKEAIKAVWTSSTTTAEVAQSALRLVAVVLRDRRDVTVKDSAVDMLLGKLKDDLTEPLYRHVTFNLLRSILDRRVETATVYDTLDYVGTVMVTNDDKDTRHLARGAFFQFLREYPQKKSRWQKQLTFIVANLKYEREGGRTSVMEVIHLLMLRSADDFVQEVASTCFVPLVFVLANDPSEACRMAAGKLVTEIFQKASRGNMRNFRKLLRSWAEQEEKPAVTKLALEVFGFYFDVAEGGEQDKNDVEMILRKSADLLEDAAEDMELKDAALQTVEVLIRSFPSQTLSPGRKNLWASIRDSLFAQGGSARFTAARLLGKYLSDFSDNGDGGQKVLTGSHGLVLKNADVAQLVKGYLKILNIDGSRCPDIGLDQAQSRAVWALTSLGGHLESAAARPDAGGEEAEQAGNDSEDATDLNLQYLFRRLTAIFRRETPPKTSSLKPKAAALDVIKHLVSNNPKEAIEPSVKRILRPLRNLTDPSIPAPFSTDDTFSEQYDALRAEANAVMEMLQKKFGTADYTRYLLAVGEDIRDRRVQRSSKRKFEAITQPEKHGLEKRKKSEKKKERRKVKGQEHRDRRRGL